MIFTIISLVLFLGHGCHSQDKPILDRWEAKGPSFTIRVTEFQEKQFPLSKFSYVFEVKRTGSAGWAEIMTTRTDDDVAIPREQVRFIGDQAAYIFMVDKYASTTNGGNSWFTWKADDGITNLKYPGQFYIKEALVHLDGSGRLIAASRSDDAQIVEFRTDDFGQNWLAK